MKANVSKISVMIIEKMITGHLLISSSVGRPFLPAFLLTKECTLLQYYLSQHFKFPHWAFDPQTSY